MVIKSHNKRLIAFDFDGVICNSAPEMGASCFDVALDLLAAKPDKRPANTEERTKFLHFFLTVRPFLEVGYQGILVALWFLNPDMRKNLPLPHENEPTAAWETFCATLINRAATLFSEGVPPERLFSDELTERLGHRRDAFLSTELTEWTRLNPLYAGMQDLLQQLLTDDGTVVAIVSTKQVRFIHAILDQTNLKIDHSLLFGLESGRKESVIAHLLECHSPGSGYFIEDRLETLRRFTIDARLNDLKLLFATWGYATPNQQNEAHGDPRITAVTQQSLVKILTEDLLST